MCGIVGRVTPGQAADPTLIRAMADTLVHRGPDASGFHLAGGAGLGMRRLAIIDVAGGAQPMHSEDRSVVLVANGEIYNHDELREELRRGGHEFATSSDVEVILHLWEEIGPRCVERLRGMFAFAIWDERTTTLFLARDRVGKKPLFYAERDGAITFGSEARAVLQDPRVPREVDPRAIDAFLTCGYVPHGLSALRGVKKLPPAATLTWQPQRGAVVDRYWRLEYEPKLRISFREAEERVRAAILDATRVRLMSEVPIGAFLSGGVDSSVVVAAMAMTSPHTVRTFSAAFPGTDVDESAQARAVASMWGTDHHELEIEPPSGALLPRLAWHFGEPFADPAALPTYQLSELISQDVTVALNGDGGDESFAGYRRYWQLALTRPADALPMAMRRGFADAALRLAGTTEGRDPLPRAARLAGRLASPPALRYAGLMRFFGEQDRHRLYTAAFRGDLGASHALAHVESAWATRAGLSTPDRLMAVDLTTYLSDDLLPKVDITSMAHSVEVRSPLLDQHLLELAARLPVRYKLRGRRSKVVLRSAVESWLPPEVLSARKKGFSVPLAAWLRQELRHVPEDLLLDPVSVDRGYFEPPEIRRLISEHHAGHDRSKQLWALINLELWHRTCVDAPHRRISELPVLH